jgi:hypothetical protein
VRLLEQESRAEEVCLAGNVRDGASFLSLVAENGQGQRVIAQEHARAFCTALLVPVQTVTKT